MCEMLTKVGLQGLSVVVGAAGGHKEAAMCLVLAPRARRAA